MWVFSRKVYYWKTGFVVQNWQVIIGNWFRCNPFLCVGWVWRGTLKINSNWNSKQILIFCLHHIEVSRACIFKPFQKPRNRFPDWRENKTTLFDVPARQATLADGIDSWASSTFTNTGSELNVCLVPACIFCRFQYNSAE